MKWPPDTSYLLAVSLCLPWQGPGHDLSTSECGGGELRLDEARGCRGPSSAQLMVEVRCQHWASRASTGPNTPPASPRPLHCTMAVPTLIILRSSSSQIPDKVTTSRIKWSNTIYLMSSVPPPWMSALSKAWYSQNLYPLENINNNIISNNDIKDYYKRLYKNINLNSYLKLLLYLWVVNWSNLHQSPHMIKTQPPQF